LSEIGNNQKKGWHRFPAKPKAMVSASRQFVRDLLFQNLPHRQRNNALARLLEKRPDLADRIPRKIKRHKKSKLYPFFQGEYPQGEGVSFILPKAFRFSL
jgi:hypothetical protein